VGVVKNFDLGKKLTKLKDRQNSKVSLTKMSSLMTKFKDKGLTKMSLLLTKLKDLGLNQNVLAFEKIER
jgi:hypothetical protein